MPTAPLSPFDLSLEHAARQRELQMWQAAQTVRAHVSAGAGLVSMLDCLGLTDAQPPNPL